MHLHAHEYSGNPFLVFGSRPRRELRLRAYIVRQHRSGRRLAEILNDPYLERHGGMALIWRTLMNPDTLGALRADTSDELERFAAEREALSAVGRREPDAVRAP